MGKAIPMDQFKEIKAVTTNTVDQNATPQNEVGNMEQLENMLRIFECVDIAREVIKEKKEKYPEHTDLIEESFKWIYPTWPLRGKTEKLYRLHVEELIERLIAEGEESLARPTEVEMLGIISESYIYGQKAGLGKIRPEAVIIYVELMKKLFPEQHEQLCREHPLPPLPDMTDEEIESVRKQLEDINTSPRDGSNMM